MPRTGDELANDIFRAGAMNGVAFVERGSSLEKRLLSAHSSVPISAIRTGHFGCETPVVLRILRQVPHSLHNLN